MEVRLVTSDTGAQPGELSPPDGSRPRELLRYRSARGKLVEISGPALPELWGAVAPVVLAPDTRGWGEGRSPMAVGLLALDLLHGEQALLRQRCTAVLP